MQSNVKRNRTKRTTVKADVKPHYSVYLNDAEKELVRVAAEKTERSVAKYIRAVLLPQAQKDAAK